MFRIRTILAAALVAGCTTNEITTPPGVPAEILGSVVGTVTARWNGLPVAGVGVSAILPDGTATATTDAAGRYVLDGLPAGATHTVRFAKAGWVPASRSVALAGVGGDTSQGNVMATADVQLSEATASVEGVVLAGPNPAVGAILTIDLRASGWDLVATAVTDATGSYRIDGLPSSGSGSVTLVVDPLDVDGDGFADWLRASTWISLAEGLTTRVDVALTPAGGSGSASSLRVISEDIQNGLHAADTPLRITFDRPVDAAATRVSVEDTTVYRTVAVSWEVDALGTSLLVAPVGGAPFAAGHEYRVSGTVVGMDGTIYSYWRYFVASAGGLPPPPVTGLSVSPAAVDVDTKTFTARWDAVSGADRYEIWIRDTLFNPNFTRLSTVGSQPAPSATLTLPSTFDYYSGDSIQTPFAWGTAVDVAVVPLGIAGASGGVGAATPVRVRDNVPPVVLSTSQEGSGENGGAAAADVRIRLAFTEYMDPSGQPAVTLPAPGMTSAFQMDPGLREGTLTVTIPPATNGSGPITVAGLADGSGNPMVPWGGRVFRRVELLANGGFESGLAGWTATQTGSASAPSAVSSPTASGAGAAFLGNPGVVAQNGYSRIHQDVAVPAGVAALGLSVKYRTDYTSYAYDDFTCGLYSTGGSLLRAVVDVRISRSTVFVSASAEGLAGFAGTTVRVQCQVYQWTSSSASRAVIDDLSLYADF